MKYLFLVLAIIIWKNPIYAQRDVSMPVPEWKEPLPMTEVERAANPVFRNIVTGETQDVPIEYTDISGKESVDVVSEYDKLLSFAPMTRVTSNRVGIARMVVSLRMEFNNNIVSTCSGVMVSPFTVLTANHCVYNREFPITERKATKIEAFPMRDGSDMPVGKATARGTLEWPQWQQFGDWNYDVALVVLDTPIGLYTDQAYIGLNFNNDQLTGWNFLNYSYPGSTLVGANGIKMYKTIGRFSRYTDSQLRAPIFSYKGMSGSAMLRRHTDGRYFVASVLSFSQGSETGTIRMNDVRYNAVSRYLSEEPQSLPDLIPIEGRLDIRDGQVESSYSSIGATLEYINYSRTTTSQLSWKVYLSRDKNLSDDDHYLGTVRKPNQRSLGFHAYSVEGNIIGAHTYEVEPGCYYVIPQIVDSDAVIGFDNSPISQGVNQRICLDPPPYCGDESVFYDTEGTFTDGSPPDQNYYQNSDCAFIVLDTTRRQRIELNLNSYDLSDDFDSFLTLYEGYPPNWSLIGSYGHGNLPPQQITTASGGLAVVFKTSPEDKYGTGFQMSYRRIGGNLQMEGQSISLHPNPASTRINLFIIDPSRERIEYRIMSISSGAVVSSGTTVSLSNQYINISSLPCGVYVLELTEEEVLKQIKFVKR